MNKTIARIKTLSTAFVTYAVLASTALTFALGELPSSAPATVGKIVGTIISFLTASVAIVRKVTPVIDADQGLLPVKDPIPKAK